MLLKRSFGKAAKAFRNAGNRGFSLVELMIVLLLMGIVLESLYLFTEYTTRAFRTIQAQSIVQDDFNKAVERIGADIRSGISPNANTLAVVIPAAQAPLSAGQQMDVYIAKGSTFQRIRYRLNPSDRSILERGSAAAAAVDPTETNPQYGAITNWETLLTGVQFLDGSSSIAIFRDITATYNSAAGADRRIISIKLAVMDADGRIPEAFILPLTFTSRSKDSSS